MDTCRHQAWQIEQCATRAWPASVVEEHRGWLLRATPGVTRRRSNTTARPPRASHAPEDALRAVEAFYAARGLPTSIQVTPAEQHGALDALLAARGYRHETPMWVLTAPAATVVARSGTHPRASVDVTDTPTPAWFDGFHHLDGLSDSPAVGTLVLPRIADPAAYASVTLDQRVVGTALFVATSGYVGVFCMAVHREHRRQGLATTLLHAGARWATARGVGRMYLQVRRASEGALRLYARAGFSRSHTYHYRVATGG